MWKSNGCTNGGYSIFMGKLLEDILENILCIFVFSIRIICFHFSVSFPCLHRLPRMCNIYIYTYVHMYLFIYLFMYLFMKFPTIFPICSHHFPVFRICIICLICLVRSLKINEHMTSISSKYHPGNTFWHLFGFAIPLSHYIPLYSDDIILMIFPLLYITYLLVNQQSDPENHQF